MQIVPIDTIATIQSQEPKHVIGVAEHGNGGIHESGMQQEVYVKKEYSYDLQKVWRTYPGVWTCKKCNGQSTLLPKTLLTDYGACFDKLP